MDRYPNYEVLRRCEKEGRDFRIRVRRGHSGIAVVAPHGGGIEAGTSELADAVAAKDHAFYSFEGIKRSGNVDLHVTSERFDEPRALELVCASDTVIALHGCGGDEEALYLGGLDFPRAERMREALLAAGFRVGDGGRRGLAGIGPANIVNRGLSGRGVQIEFSYGLRSLLFRGLTAPERRSVTQTFHRLVAALRAGIEAPPEIPPGIPPEPV